MDVHLSKHGIGISHCRVVMRPLSDLLWGSRVVEIKNGEIRNIEFGACQSNAECLATPVSATFGQSADNARDLIGHNVLAMWATVT